MQKMSVLTIHTYKKMMVSIRSFYKKMRITLVFEQLFIFAIFGF